MEFKKFSNEYYRIKDNNGWTIATISLYQDGKWKFAATNEEEFERDDLREIAEFMLQLESKS